MIVLYLKQVSIVQFSFRTESGVAHDGGSSPICFGLFERWRNIQLLPSEERATMKPGPMQASEPLPIGQRYYSRAIGNALRILELLQMSDKPLNSFVGAAGDCGIGDAAMLGLQIAFDRGQRL